MSYTNVMVEKRDQIGFITLNRPQAMNTFNVPFARELNDALWEMEKDPEVRGGGDRCQWQTFLYGHFPG